MRRAVGRITGAILAMVVGAGAAQADYSVYEDGDTKVDFSMTMVGALFENSDSWFGEDESFIGTDTDSWTEIGAEAGLTLEFALGTGTAFGAVSGIYTETFSDDASGLTVGIDDPQDTTLEQFHVGWRIEDTFSGLTNDTLSFSIGRQDYAIGTGILINDGAGDGGERGGWYLGMRKAFPEAALIQLKSDELLLEFFQLENDPRRGGTNGEATGINAEYYFADKGSLGGSYLYVDAQLPGADELDVYSGRGEWKPVTGLSLSGEYVHENSDEIEADGWYAQGSYEFAEVAWSPQLVYRYAQFDGDDPDTSTDERFREVAYGFTDYGYWYQGEITGNYPLGNGNLQSHMLRAMATPVEGVTASLFYYDFSLDHPESLDPAVTSDDWGNEVNLTIDWEVTDTVYIIGVLGVLMPGNAAEQWVGGDEDWGYAMFYVSFSL